MIQIDMKMPGSCKECRFFDEEDLCYIDDTYAISDEQIKTKPKWCPLIDNLPTIAGNWIIDINDKDYCFCQFCRYKFEIDSLKMIWGTYEFPPHCPNCGAELKGELLIRYDEVFDNHISELKGENEQSRCNNCQNNTDELSGECYECVKGIEDWYEPISELKGENK